MTYYYYHCVLPVFNNISTCSRLFVTPMIWRSTLGKPRSWSSIPHNLSCIGSSSLLLATPWNRGSYTYLRVLFLGPIFTRHPTMDARLRRGYVTCQVGEKVLLLTLPRSVDQVSSFLFLGPSSRYVWQPMLGARPFKHRLNERRAPSNIDVCSDDPYQTFKPSSDHSSWVWSLTSTAWCGISSHHLLTQN